MAFYKTRAISLKTAPFAEADKLVTLFTRDHGKIRAIAKGARRVPSRLGVTSRYWPKCRKNILCIANRYYLVAHSRPTTK